MKCPQCKAWTIVKETRQRVDGSIYRRYQCANGHRFTTCETVQESRYMKNIHHGPDGKFISGATK